MTKTLINAKDSVIPTYFQRVLYRTLIKQGVSLTDLLEGLEIQEHQFLSDDFRFSFEHHSRFIQNALRTTGDPHLGWRLGQNINISSLGVLGHAVMASSTCASAIDKLSRFFQLRAPSYDLKLIESGYGSTASALQIDESFDFGEVRYFMLSCIASAFDNIFKFLTQYSDIIERIELACSEPVDWSERGISVNYPVTFDAQLTRLYLPNEFLNMQLPTADPDTERSSTEACLHLLSNVENQSGIVKEVRKFIINFSDNYPSLTNTADHLCLSPRTLRRELEKSNTTYQKILDDIRFSAAKSMLLNTSKTSTEIGFELGFKDTSNFNRAFKKWSGLTPSMFRNRR